ncbi:MAG: hypothetical protein C5B51_01495 [Terriglobia bacterium]|nr:MAG: hypothetical protein C5B51_01495 [Terriglobia bacterium]
MMRRFVLSAFIVVSIGFGITGTAKADFVNGSFETGDTTGWTTTYSSFDSGLNPFGTTYGTGMDGTYWAWLAGYEQDISFSQTLTGLTAGVTYAVDFIMASEAYNSDQIHVSADGGPATTFTAPPYNPGGGINGGFWDVWVSQEFQFTATGTTATIQFDTFGLNSGCCDVGLDNVHLRELTQVPEPVSLIPLCLLAGGMIYRRRKAHQAN